MSRPYALLVAVVLFGLVALGGIGGERRPSQAHRSPSAPARCPCQGGCSCLPPCVCGIPRAFVQTFDEAKVGGNVAPDGTEIQCDLPRALHIKNVGGSDGAGLCVFASLTHSSYWQHCRQTETLFKWMQQYPGGGYPQKVDAKIAQLSKEQGMEVPEYIQIESRDLEPLKLACKTRRMPGVTYGFSPTGRYGGGHIAHMVSLAHADEKWFGVLDNNFPGTIEWMDPATFLKTYTSGSKNGWAVIFLNPPPPPAPRNLE